jgi:ribosomal RNA assembly protein
MTGVDISIYGKTVAIIGDMEQIHIAKEAVEMILNGVRHKTVYAFLERKTRDMKIKQFHKMAKDETDLI